MGRAVLAFRSLGQMVEWAYNMLFPDHRRTMQAAAVVRTLALMKGVWEGLRLDMAD